MEVSLLCSQLFLIESNSTMAVAAAEAAAPVLMTVLGPLSSANALEEVGVVLCRDWLLNDQSSLLQKPSLSSRFAEPERCGGAAFVYDLLDVPLLPIVDLHIRPVSDICIVSILDIPIFPI